MAFKLTKKTGLLLLLATALISGVSIFLNSYAVKGFDSSVFTFAKNIVVAVLLFAIILGFGMFGEIKTLKKKQWAQLSLIGLVGGSIPFLLFFKGLQMTTGSAGSFLQKTLFVFAAVLAVLFLKEKLSKGWIVGAVLVMVGTFIVMKPVLGFSLGYALILGSVLFWAVENVYAKHVLKEVSGTLVAFGRMFFGSLFIFAFLLFSNKTSLIVSMNIAQYLWVGLTAGLLFLYVLTYYNGLKVLNVSTAASILTIGAPITAVLDIVLRGVALTPLSILGYALVVVGVLCIVWFSSISKFFASFFRRISYGRD